MSDQRRRLTAGASPADHRAIVARHHAAQRMIERLAEQLVFDETKAVQTLVTQYGTKYNQVIRVTGANGKVVDVVTAWIRNADDGTITLITATPP